MGDESSRRYEIAIVTGSSTARYYGSGVHCVKDQRTRRGNRQIRFGQLSIASSSSIASLNPRGA